MTCNLRHPMSLRHPVYIFMTRRACVCDPYVYVRMNLQICNWRHMYVYVYIYINRCAWPWLPTPPGIPAVVLQCVAVCCSVLQCGSAWVNRCGWRACLWLPSPEGIPSVVLQCVAVWCSVLQCVAVWVNGCGRRACYQLLQVRLLVCCSVLQSGAVLCSLVQCGAVWCSVWCSVV